MNTYWQSTTPSFKYASSSFSGMLMPSNCWIQVLTSASAAGSNLPESCRTNNASQFELFVWYYVSPAPKCLKVTRVFHHHLCFLDLKLCRFPHTNNKCHFFLNQNLTLFGVKSLTSHRPIVTPVLGSSLTLTFCFQF